MTSLINDFKFKQDRVGVVYDYIGETFLERHLKELYGKNENQFVYLNNEEFNAENLFNMLREKIDNGELVTSQGDRMIYCHYLELSALSTEWVDRFFDQSKKMLKLVPYNNLPDQYHMICFRVSASKIPESEVEPLSHLLLRLGTEYQNEVSRQIYILREQGLSSNQFRKQEYGIAQLFHLCSRMGHTNLQPIQVQNTGIQMVRYTDYYANQKDEFQKRLDSVEHWLNDESDQGHRILIDALVSLCSPLIDEMRSVERRFTEDSTVYPVRVTEYSGNCILGYKRNEGYVRKRLASLREETIKKKALEIVFNTDFSTVLHVLDDYSYKDMISLMKNSLMKESDSGSAPVTIEACLLKDGLKNGKGREVVSAVYDKFMSEISGRIDPAKLEEQRNKKTIEKRQLIVLLNEAGQFSDMDDCFQHINMSTQLNALGGKPLADRFAVCLVNGSFIDDWDVNNSVITDVDNAYVYTSIDPLQVVMLREYTFLSFDNPKSIEQIDEDLKLLF